MTNIQIDPTEEVLADGLNDLWYAICPSSFVNDRAVSLRRVGYKIALWRDPSSGKVHALEDHCPHRGAPLSLGIVLGDRVACPYHGVEVRHDGVVTRVPGSPGCKLEGTKSTKSFHVKEVAGVIFLYKSSTDVAEPPPLDLPEQLTSDEWTHFVCYTEWGNDYRYVIDNVMDPMHGAFLHKMSHTMFGGSQQAEFESRDTEHGFIFEKKGQKDVNFDWSEFIDTGIHTLRLEIPYPKTGGPGGNFTIVGSYTPISKDLCTVIHWRCRKLTGWQRDVYRFLYKNRLEARHWDVLEQDRVALENMELDANKREFLYSHDMGVVRARRFLKGKANEQLARGQRRQSDVLMSMVKTT